MGSYISERMFPEWLAWLPRFQARWPVKRWVVQLRRSTGYSQVRFAELLDVGESSVKRWEWGSAHPTYEMMLKLLAVDLRLQAKGLLDPQDSMWRRLVSGTTPASGQPVVVDTLMKSLQSLVAA